MPFSDGDCLSLPLDQHPNCCGIILLETQRHIKLQPPSEKGFEEFLWSWTWLDLQDLSQTIDPLWPDANQIKERLVSELVHCCVKGQVQGMLNSPLYTVITRMKLVHKHCLLVALGLGLQGSDDQRLLQGFATVCHLMVCNNTAKLQLSNLLSSTDQELCAM